MRLLEMLLVAFLLWVIANVIRAVAFKSSKGGGFWGLHNWMTNADAREAAAREEAVQKEIARRLAAVGQPVAPKQPVAGQEGAKVQQG